MDSESRGNIQKDSMLHLYGSERRVKDQTESGRFKDDDTNGIDIPFIDLETILIATENFSNANKLGQGGFGPVYKVHILNLKHFDGHFKLVLVYE